MESKEFFKKLEETKEGQEYLNLISEAKSKGRGLNREPGFEIHHILPRAFSGGHENSNRVKLTVCEHCIAHILLAKAIPCYKTLQPLTRLAGRQIVELSEFDRNTMGELLKDFADMRDKVLHARKPEEVRIKIVEALRRRAADPEYRKKLHKPKSEETKQRMRKPKSEEHRKKLGEVNKRKGQEYWEQKKKYLETGVIEGDQLKALLRRTETIREQNRLRKQIALREDFQIWYKIHGFNEKGRRLNQIVCVSRYLKELGQTLEEYIIKTEQE